jgi:hypothetical protein
LPDEHPTSLTSLDLRYTRMKHHQVNLASSKKGRR